MKRRQITTWWMYLILGAVIMKTSMNHVRPSSLGRHKESNFNSDKAVKIAVEY